MEEEEVCELVRSVIMSEKGGVQLKNLNKDFMSLAGEPIPYKKLGYKSVEELLSIIPEVKRLVNRNGEVVYTSTGKNCEHLASLISKQKSSKKSSNHVINHPKNIVSHHQSGYSGMHHGKMISRRNSVLGVERNSKGHQHQKSIAEKKHIPKEKDTSTTKNTLGLEPGSGAKIDLPRLIRRQENHRKSTPDRILGEPCDFDDIRMERDEMPALVPSGRQIWNHEPRTLQMLDKSPRVYQGTFQHSGRTKGKPGLDLRSVLGSNPSRDFLHGKMRSDYFKVNHFGNHNPPRLRQRFSYDAQDLESHRRESFSLRRQVGIPSTLCDNDTEYGWKDEDESRLYSEDSKSNFTDRKFDFVSGMLRVTIKNS